MFQIVLSSTKSTRNKKKKLNFHLQLSIKSFILKIGDSTTF